MRISEDDVACQACLDLARAAVNDDLHTQKGSVDHEAGLSRRIQNDVCILCECSTVCRQRCPGIRENSTEVQQSIVSIIRSKVEPRNVCSPWSYSSRGPRLDSYSIQKKLCFHAQIPFIWSCSIIKNNNLRV